MESKGYRETNSHVMASKSFLMISVFQETGRIWKPHLLFNKKITLIVFVTAESCCRCRMDFLDIIGPNLGCMMRDRMSGNWRSFMSYKLVVLSSPNLEKKHWWKELAPIYSPYIRYIAILDSEYVFINVHHADRNEPCVEFLQWLQAGYQYQQYIEDTGALTS